MPKHFVRIAGLKEGAHSQSFDIKEKFFEAYEKSEVKEGEFIVNSLLNIKGIDRKITLNIDPGQFIGIVGATGSGKTTIAKLLLRFYDVNEGKITIGHENIKNLSIKDLRQNIAFVSQETFLFDGSIKENICYPNSEIDEQ